MPAKRGSNKRRPKNRGHFKKGHDPRRHVFTNEECARGYEQAKLKVNEQFPEARCQHGAALSHCLLRIKNPLYFEARRLEKQLTRLERNHKHDGAKLAGLRRELEALKIQAHKARQRKRA
jgi:hypothetical protein